MDHLIGTEITCHAQRAHELADLKHTLIETMFAILEIDPGAYQFFKEAESFVFDMAAEGKSNKRAS